MAKYFDPLNGGAKHAGWPLGDLRVADLHALLDAVPGVDYVEEDSLEMHTGAVDLPSSSGSYRISLPATHLPYLAAESKLDVLREGET